MAKQGFIEKLKKRWQLESAFQVVIILLVFAFTGTSVMLLKRPLLNLLGEGLNESVWYNILYYIFLLPAYQILLLLYAFIFGQFKFFWAFEKRFFKRMANIFTKKKAP